MNKIRTRKTKEKPKAINTGWERYNGNGTWRPDWLTVRRCKGNRDSFVAATLREDGTELGVGFTCLTSYSLDSLLHKVNLVWPGSAIILDLFVWQEAHQFLGEGI